MDDPVSLSKSIARAMACPRFFALRYLEAGVEILSPAAESGRQFHAYRAAYLDYLRQMRLARDPDWVEAYLARQSVSGDAAELIARDAAWFSIDPERIFATELFLGVDGEGRPTEMEEGARPGRGPSDPATRMHGTLDLVELSHGRAPEGERATPLVLTIRDPKSGWSRAISEYEAIHYAGLALAHFPYVSEVVFEWEYVRVNARVPLRFLRADDAGWVVARMQSTRRAMLDLVAEYRAGKAPAIDPTSGLCPICAFACPAREAVQRGYLDSAPLQTREDAIAVAKLTHVANLYAIRGRELLEQWVESHGPLEAGPHLVADIHATAREEFSLADVLGVLGFSDDPDLAVASSPRWDVPLGSIKVSASDLKSFAKAKKRAGMKAELVRIAKRKPHFELHLGKPDPKAQSATSIGRPRE